MGYRVKGGGGGGGGVPTDADIRWEEGITTADNPSPILVLPEENQVDSVPSVNLGLIDPIEASDDSRFTLSTLQDEVITTDDQVGPILILPEELSVDSQPSIIPQFLEGVEIGSIPTFLLQVDDDVSANDRFLANLNNIQYGRSGTPDTDTGADSYIQQGNPTVNFGSNVNILVQAPFLGSNATQGKWYADLTHLADFTAKPGGTHSLVLHTAATGLGATNLDCQLKYHTARPWTESTVTWNAPGTAGTAIRTAIISVALAAGFTTLPLTDADVNAILGKWFIILFVSTDTTTVPTITIGSRERVTANERPKLNLQLQRSA